MTTTTQRYATKVELRVTRPNMHNPKPERSTPEQWDHSGGQGHYFTGYGFEDAWKKVCMAYPDELVCVSVFKQFYSDGSVDTDTDDNGTMQFRRTPKTFSFGQFNGNELDNVRAVYFKRTREMQQPNEPVYLYTHDKSIDLSCFDSVKICDLVDDDFDGDRFFIFAVADCFSPPHDLVRGKSWEDAYEKYIDFAAEKRHLAISEEDLSDYENSSGEYEGSYTSNGTPVDTEAVQGFEVFLSRIEW